MLDKKVKVKTVKSLGAANFLITLGAPEQARLTQAGQFVMLKCDTELEGLPLLRRPFSIFNTHPSERTGKPGGLDLLVKDVGPGSHKLALLSAGDEVYVLGPQGRPFQVAAGLQNRVRTAFLVAGGVGIAALYLLARKLQSAGVQPILFYGGRSSDELVLREHFEALGIETCYATEDGSMGERGFVTLPLAARLKNRAASSLRIYACGPWAMMKAVHELAAGHRIPCEVSLEARMGCSLGACMGCVIGARDESGSFQYLRVCLEGPVMDSYRVDWNAIPF